MISSSEVDEKKERILHSMGFVDGDAGPE